MARGWFLLVYRLPPQPSSTRVAVWRELRRLGAVMLQQSCVVLPTTKEATDRLEAIEARIRAAEGTHFRFELRDLDAETDRRLRARWSELRSEEYADIVEECRSKFITRIEFEVFRDNLTATKAEELEADLEKIERRLSTVARRDLFGASGRQDAETAIVDGRAALDDFIARVYEREAEEADTSTVRARSASWEAESPAGREGSASTGG